MANRNTLAQNQHGITKDQRGQEQSTDQRRARQHNKKKKLETCIAGYERVSRQKNK
jgi:hypothetical protein